MKIGILGGSFDPPHNGHLAVANTLLQHGYCQGIILMPCFVHPFNKPLSDAKHRLTMTRLSISCHSELVSESRSMLKSKILNRVRDDTRRITPNIEVSDLEIKKGKISYTIDTLKALKKQSPKDEFMWIIGEDQLENFEKWKGWKQIIEKFGLIVVPRASLCHAEFISASRLFRTEIPKQVRDDTKKTLLNITVLDKKNFTPFNISSSEIRKRIKEGISINNLVPERVKSYIIEHDLYSKEY